MNINGFSYRQWQKRNTDTFQKLSKEQKQTAREQGYYNVGWQRVQQSWEILQQKTEPRPLFDAKLKRGDLTGAINQSILEAEQAQNVAQKGVSNLQRKRKRIKDLAETAQKKYQLL